MATRKKPAPPVQSSLFAFPSMTKPKEEPHPSFSEDAYGSGSVRADAPITPTSLPVVARDDRDLEFPPPLPDITPDEDVVVEPDGKRYAVSLIRHGGGSVATVLYTRKQLEMLLARIPAALEVGT